ncbi:hydrolase [Dechloromonas denitrificans]|uniref:Hydrolase n=1 Tax=Dechloromonas denitrificans TaxID=281362 RepID=A0A133XG68_9RHOO|nr:hydrolase [Dechloromonas denitrificans]KXB29945.1 hydrolase [Dechloromonas denitrificans]
MLIRRDDSLLLLVDLQEKLAPAIFEGERVIANSVRLLEGARQLGVPAFVSEQYVRGLGPSVAAIRSAAIDAHFFEKTHFSCAAEPGVIDLLRAARRPQVVLTGTETHVCVLQTAFGLLGAGFEVFLVADAASSRTPENRSAAIERMRAAGIQIVTSEMVLFEWLHAAGTDEFRRLLPLIK